MNKLKDIIPALQERKKMFLSVVAVGGLSVVLFLGGTRLTLTYSERQKAESRIQAMERYVREYQAVQDKINSAELHPVSESEVERIQTAILLHFKKYALNLESLKEVQNENSRHGHVYQVSISGSYESTVDCLRTFFVRSSLIGFRAMSMQMRNGSLHTTLTYKIYTK